MAKLLLFVLTVISILVIAAIVAVSRAESRKSYWDHKIAELCRADGGVKVYEVVHIGNTTEEQIAFRRKKLSNTEKTPYRRVEQKVLLNPKDPEVYRHQFAYYRSSNMKLLGTLVIYARVGGDFPLTVSNRSHFSCVNLPEFSNATDELIFALGQYEPTFE